MVFSWLYKHYKPDSSTLVMCSFWIMLLLHVKDALAFYSPAAFAEMAAQQSKNNHVETDTSQESKEESSSMLDKFYYFTSCDYEGQRYPPGYFSPSPCVNCNCNATTGRIHCAFADCSQRANCIHYAYTPGECCPQCLKKGCFHNGTAYPPGAKIPLGPCEHCYCPWEGGDENTGEPVCMQIECPPVRCVDAEVPAGKCCPVCNNGECQSAFVV